MSKVGIRDLFPVDEAVHDRLLPASAELHDDIVDGCRETRIADERETK
jgi:hypothetical protein